MTYMRKSLDSGSLNRNNKGGRRRRPFIESQIRIIGWDEEADNGDTANVEK